MMRLHGTCVAISGTGVLLRGPSGSGKSDLALRLIDAGARLVADDQVELRMIEGTVMASAPASLAGLMEVRGVGILTVPSASAAPLALVVDLVAPEAVERLPDLPWCDVAGGRLPRLSLAPFEASTPAKVRLAVAAAGDGRLGVDPSVAKPAEPPTTPIPTTP